MDISFGKMVQGVLRAREVNESAEAHPVVKRLFVDMLDTPATELVDANDGVTVAETVVAQASDAVTRATVGFAVQFGMVRAMMAARFPAQVLPVSFREKSTDTLQLLAISTLLALVETHRGEVWANEVLAGEFGTTAPDVIAKMTALIAARESLQVKQAARVAAFEAVYPVYLAFKETVRQTHGSASRLYRKLAIRGHHAAAAAPAAVTPSPVVTAVAPTNGASPH